MTVAKSVLGGHVYLVYKSEGVTVVGRAPREGEAAVEYGQDEDGICSCKAGEFGGECKHDDMRKGTLGGPRYKRGKAELILQDYLDKVREQWPKARISSTLRHKRADMVDSATAIATGVLSEHSQPRFTLWTEVDGLVVRIHCFRDYKDYRRAVTFVRKSAAAEERERANGGN